LRPIDDAIIASNQEIADTFFAEGVIPKKLVVESVFTKEFNADAQPVN
jgi:hypothetical protein